MAVREDEDDEDDEDDEGGEDGWYDGAGFDEEEEEQDVKPNLSALEEIGPSGWEKYTDLVVSKKGKLEGVIQQVSRRVRNVLRVAGTRTDLCISALREAAERLGEQRIGERLRRDRDYADTMAGLLPQRISSFRLQCRHKAQHMLEKYGLSQGSEILTVAITDLLNRKDGYLYIFPGEYQKNNFQETEPFCHRAIISHLARTFFGSQPVIRFDDEYYVVDKWGPDEPELPAPMIAFSATAVAAGLKDYQTGDFRPVHFQASDKKGTTGFYDIYVDHMRTLRDLERVNPEGYHQLTAYLYQAAAGFVVGPTDVEPSGSRHGRVNTKVDMKNVGKSLKFRA
ncbi:hypothetical protein BV25DRAFT_1922791 [Artomyces pyxidatus]|uniref:Uncharacterized protein n=1 Tax=Artomyces pyxidatus TaxID=48021 RepID=A0ACB8SCZ0_9AGAM|nr:hypothetical protein BV25DRAFT_1922791 [Artomyces pyxidatus]